MGEGDSTVSVFDSAPPALAGGARRDPRARRTSRGRAACGSPCASASTPARRERRDGDYFGPTLNLAARVRGQADGGQIFLSSATRGAGRRAPPRRLRRSSTSAPTGCEGVGAPEQIHAVARPRPEHAAPRRRVPVPRAAGVRARTTARFFFGREDVVADLIERLAPAAGCSRSWARRAAASPRCCAPASSRRSLAGEVAGHRPRDDRHPGRRRRSSTSGDAATSSSSSTSSRSCSRSCDDRERRERVHRRAARARRPGRDRRARRLLRRS